MRIFIPLLVLILSLNGACEELHLGAVFNTKGAQAALDLPSYRGAKLAAELWREPVKLWLAEGRSVPEDTARRTLRLCEEHPRLLALVGLSDSDEVVAAASVAARKKSTLRHFWSNFAFVALASTQRPVPGLFRR